MSALLAHLPALERRLVAAVFPAISPWWSATLARFYASGRRQLVLRVGRRGGKSSSLCRLAILECLFGAHRVPPGDVGIFAIVSTTRDEAAQRLRTVRAILDALGVAYRTIDHGIELATRPIAIKTYVATVAGVVGFTCIGVLCDEVARWRDSETGANPATEVLASLRPTLATMPSARIFLSSSPLGNDDAHATAFDAGDDDFQCVAYAPTWTANPTISEAETHRLERDDRVWRREYLAEPQAGVLAAFDARLIDRALATSVPTDWRRHDPVILLDPSAGGADSFTWCAARWRRQTGGPPAVLEIVCMDGIASAAAEGITSDQVVARVAALARRVGATHVHADQFERYALASAFARLGLSYTSHTWTAETKARAVEHVRGWLRDGVLALEPHARLRAELLSFEERITSSGVLTFRGRGATHDDHAMLLLLAALVDTHGQLRGSPSGPRAPGSGLLEFFEMEIARLKGGPTPLHVTAPDAPEMVDLGLPEHLRGSSMFDYRGTIYRVDDGRIRVPAECVEDLECVFRMSALHLRGGT